jgi:hypothetical protein
MAIDSNEAQILRIMTRKHGIDIVLDELAVIAEENGAHLKALGVAGWAAWRNVASSLRRCARMRAIRLYRENRK